MRTCLDCGFLTIEGRELEHSDRMMLGVEGSATMPANPERIRCHRGLWDYDFHPSVDTQNRPSIDT